MRAEWTLTLLSPGDGDELTCPGQDEAGVCGTSFIYEPFRTEREAHEALNDPASEALRWAPWARWAMSKRPAERPTPPRCALLGRPGLAFG